MVLTRPGDQNMRIAHGPTAVTATLARKVAAARHRRARRNRRPSAFARSPSSRRPCRASKVMVGGGRVGAPLQQVELADAVASGKPTALWRRPCTRAATRPSLLRQHGHPLPKGARYSMLAVWDCPPAWRQEEAGTRPGAGRCG